LTFLSSLLPGNSLSASSTPNNSCFDDGGPGSLLGPHLTDVLRYWNVPEQTYAWSLPRLELLLGYPPSAIQSSTIWWFKLVHPDDRARVRRSLQRFVEAVGLRFWAEEYRVLAADGEYVAVIDQLRVLERSTDGTPVRCVGALFSPVQRQQLDDILQGPHARLIRDIQKPRGFSSDAADLLKTVTDNSASGLFMMDSNGHPTYMNRAAEQLTGWTLAEIADRPLHYAVHYKKPDGSPYPLEECPVDNSQAELRAAQNQHEIFCDRWGRLFPVVWSVAPLAKGGRTIGAVIEFRDVTHEQQIEREKLRLLVEAEAERAKMNEAETNRLKMAEFVDYICHEIR
jgi:PAS domain S-box-containing protein